MPLVRHHRLWNEPDLLSHLLLALIRYCCTARPLRELAGLTAGQDFHLSPKIE